MTTSCKKRNGGLTSSLGAMGGFEMQRPMVLTVSLTSASKSAMMYDGAGVLTGAGTARAGRVG